MSIKVEPFAVGDFIHVWNRGNKKAQVFFRKTDYWRFSRILRFFNDERDINELASCLTDLIASQKNKKAALEKLDPLSEHNTFDWCEEWGAQKPLVEIVAYCLMSNHYHLLLREIVPGGISKFMQKLGTGYTMYSNAISGETGRVFQGQYRGKIVADEKNLQYLDAYIQVLNPFELFEGGISGALRHFDEAFQFALDYPFCSLGESFGLRNLNIVKRDCFKETFADLSSYKEFCRDALIVRNAREFLGKLTME